MVSYWDRLRVFQLSHQSIKTPSVLYVSCLFFSWDKIAMSSENVTIEYNIYIYINSETAIGLKRMMPTDNGRINFQII